MKKKNSLLSQALNIFFKLVFSRTLIIGMMLIIQILVLAASFRWLGAYLHFIIEGLTLLGAVLIIYIVNREEDAAFKIAWIIPICIIPVFGALLYLFVMFNPGSFGMKKGLERRIRETAGYRNTDDTVRLRIAQEEPEWRQLSKYIEEVGGYPAYTGTAVTYFPVGEDKFKDLLEELENAKRFIFLEYFIVERGFMWNSILDILKRKVHEGVEVRVMYDGMCSLLLLPYNYPKELGRYGIKAKMFSPIVPALSTHQNNRDHRKILVIDDEIAYTGGVNLADEYINEKERFGHWKDVAVKIKGSAVKSFTVMFLEMWNAESIENENYADYIGTGRSLDSSREAGGGYVIPYGDGPTQKESVAENVYIDMLYHAKKYVHIMSPYLILDDRMLSALTYTALRGVEVKLILPHIPDKRIAFNIARTYYPTLLKAGVQLYEYTPGFVHAKLFVSDDEKAVVGTINLDFRSLYLHFECGAYIYRNRVIADIEKDYQETLARCQEVSMSYFRKIPLLSRLSGRLFRLFGPLM